MDNTAVLTNYQSGVDSTEMKHIPSGYHAFIRQLKALGLDPAAALDFLKEELVKLAREKKQAGYTWQEFHDMVYKNGFECVYFPEA